MKDGKTLILVVAATVREGRKSLAVAKWYSAQAQTLWPSARFELLDVRTLNLPLFREETPPIYGSYSAAQLALARRIAEADGFVFVTGEYNKSLPASLKNLLDYVYQEWNRKAAAVLCYGGTGGGLRAAEHLGQVLGSLGVALIRNSCSIHQVWGAFNDEGQFQEASIAGDLVEQLQELRWWVEALQGARTHSDGV